MDKLKLVEVYWQDASTEGHETHNLLESQAYSPSLVRTVGYVTREDENQLTLVMTHFYSQETPIQLTPEDGFKLHWIIPKGCITKIRELK